MDIILPADVAVSCYGVYSCIVTPPDMVTKNGIGSNLAEWVSN